MSCVKALTLPSPSRNGKQKKTALSLHRRSTFASHTFASHRRRRSAASTDSLDLGSLVWRGEESAGKIEWKRKTDRVKETCKGKYFLQTDTKTKERFKRVESGFKKSKEITARLLVHIGTLKLYSIYLFYMPPFTLKFTFVLSRHSGRRFASENLQEIDFL